VSEVSTKDGNRVVKVQHAALIDFGDVTDGVYARARGVDAQRAGVGVNPAVGLLESFGHEGGARCDADGGNVDVGGQGLAGVEVHFGLAVGALGVFVDLGVVEDCDTHGGELVLGFFGERLAESREQFVAGCDECDAGLATELCADFASGFDCNGAAATDDDIACGSEACVHFLESLDGDVVVTVQGSARRGRADTSGNNKGVVRKSLGGLAAEGCVSDVSRLDINASSRALMEDDRVLELRVLFETVHDGLEVLVVGCVLHRDKFSGCANVPPEVSRLVDNVQDIFGIFRLGELWQSVLDDVVSGAQSSEVGADDNNVTRFGHDGEAFVDVLKCRFRRSVIRVGTYFLDATGRMQ